MGKRGRNRDDVGDRDEKPRGDGKSGGAGLEGEGPSSALPASSPSPVPMEPVRALWLWRAVGLWAAWLAAMICMSRNEWFRPRVPEGADAESANVAR